MVAGWGGGDTNTLVIDLKNMKYLTWDTTDATIAHVGAGSLLGDLTTEMLTKNRAMAHGTCPQVGGTSLSFMDVLCANIKSWRTCYNRRSRSGFTNVGNCS
jgi:hypothetical protein